MHMTTPMVLRIPSARIVPAAASRVVLACLLDCLILGTAVVVTAVLGGARLDEATVVAGWLTIALLAGQLRLLSRCGQSLGWRACGLRLATRGRFPTLGLRKCAGTALMVADLRAGADPLLPLSRVVATRERPTSLVRRSPPGCDLRSPDRRSQASSEDLRWSREREREPLAEETIFVPHATPRWRVLLDGTDIGTLTGTMVFGRNPPPAKNIRAVAVLDLRREVSKQHLRLTMTATQRTSIEDLASTNGSVVVFPDGREEPLIPGAPKRLGEHMTVRFSGHTLQIVRKGRIGHEH